MIDQDQLNGEFQRVGELVQQKLERVLTARGETTRLLSAMRYASLNGGKRIRPFLLYQCAGLFNVCEDSKATVAAAIEMVHCYSLIHDDLPAMDDDDMRRGLPTTHIVYDEATAILAGNALLTLAYDLLSQAECHANPQIRLRLIKFLSDSVGHKGMLGGQMMDLQAKELKLDMGGVTRLQHLKTGCLIDFSCRAGGYLGGASDHLMEMLRGYAHAIGLAYQMTDDLLDVSGQQDLVGKRVGKDEAENKVTFVSLLGEEDAREHVKHLVDHAVDYLKDFGAKADMLRALAYYILERRM